ncbi:hypothetical protein ACHAXA_001971 [Cyclostephanos tholiformis]|uniref:Multidrug and toxic compound extrusion protein n=1 Tax=Cyclostephanos tholiformis TaxID=382380 RepID=A0ABD3SDL9_9STRA
MNLLAKFTDIVDVADEVYDNYVATTMHPGNALFVIALCISIGGIVGLPLMVKLGRYFFVTDDGSGSAPLITSGGKRPSSRQQADDSPPRGGMRSHIGYLWKVIKFDVEMRRILRLAIPLICSANILHAANLVILAIISNYIGTDAMIAFSMVTLITGVSSSFLMGWIETIDSIGSMAFGAENYDLTGQYARASSVCYILCTIPTGFFWYTIMDKIMLLMGFEDSVANMARDLVFVYVAYDALDGLNSGAQKFLAVIERETYSNVVYCLEQVADVALVALFVIKFDATSLKVLVVVMLISRVVFFLIGNILIPHKLGWLEDFSTGLFGRGPRWSVVKDVLDAALPLAFGQLLEEAEWEILTMFAAILGPAEAATWATMSFIWDSFESTTGAIGDASEMRVAYHLGKCRPEMAKLAGYKSMFVAFVMGLFGSAIFLSLDRVLPSLLTKDATIQQMLLDLFPLIAMSNVSMTVGMVAWTVVGGQGRYDLATKLAIACSFLVTCPVAGVLTVWMRINLQSLVFAMHLGYILAGMLLCTCVQLSNWEALSIKIQEQMKDDHDHDSDESSTSSSTSSRPKVEHNAEEEENKKDR